MCSEEIWYFEVFTLFLDFWSFDAQNMYDVANMALKSRILDVLGITFDAVNVAVLQYQ